MNSNNPTVKIHVSELQIGMYVSKLDRDWLGTPFLMQGLLIESKEDIDLIAEYAQHVWIDAIKVQASSTAKTTHRTPSRHTYINKVPTEVELGNANAIHREARRITKSFLDEVRLGGVIDSEVAKSTVKSCVDSIMRSPDALLWMSRMRNEDEYTSEHCLNVCILAIAFGRHLGLSEGELENLGLCGLLHDVGKMRIPTGVLNKPTPLTPKEFNMIKAHPVHGRNLLMSSPGIYTGAIDVAYSHHEKVNGSGYPRKLTGQNISRFSKIIGIVDAYDAMTADRCYARAISSADALNNIYKDRGSHFDEELGLEFIKCVGIYPAGTLVELVNGCIAIVLETNVNFKHLPKVIIVHDPKNPNAKERVIDLADTNDNTLDRAYLVRRGLRDGTNGISISSYRDKGLVFKM
jgi:HD-GYP domain-containing protein (c-di-GMP phosphodiesterase class II)